MQNKHFQRGGYGDRGADLGSTGYPEVRSFTEKHRSHRESKSNQNQIKIKSKSNQNQIRIKIISNQNQIKTKIKIKSNQNQDQIQLVPSKLLTFAASKFLKQS